MAKEELFYMSSKLLEADGDGDRWLLKHIINMRALFSPQCILLEKSIQNNLTDAVGGRCRFRHRSSE